MKAVHISVLLLALAVIASEAKPNWKSKSTDEFTTQVTPTLMKVSLSPTPNKENSP